MEIPYDDKASVEKLVYRYVEGLQWVMHYYYGGVASWGWFYDYHYAPRISGGFIRILCRNYTQFAADLKGIDKMTFNFQLGVPFKPYQQLMGVLPEASKEHIPEAYRVRTREAQGIIDFKPLY